MTEKDALLLEYYEENNINRPPRNKISSSKKPNRSAMALEALSSTESTTDDEAVNRSTDRVPTASSSTRLSHFLLYTRIMHSYIFLCGYMLRYNRLSEFQRG